MSVKVKEWLKRLGIEVGHEERIEIDREIEVLTGKPCDEGIDWLSEQEFLYIVEKIRRRKEKRSTSSEVLAEVLA